LVVAPLAEDGDGDGIVLGPVDDALFAREDPPGGYVKTYRREAMDFFQAQTAALRKGSR
jgi:hypothetical protein